MLAKADEVSKGMVVLISGLKPEETLRGSIIDQSTVHIGPSTSERTPASPGWLIWPRRVQAFKPRLVASGAPGILKQSDSRRSFQSHILTCIIRTYAEES